jgi:hypothetical protein
MATQGTGNRSATAEQPPSKPKRQPEKKIGPFANGVGVCIWLNTIETDEGPRQMRSITINPRRYFDRESNAWKDAQSYNPADLPALIFCLQKAQEYVYETPLPNQQASDNPGGNGIPEEEIPF